MNSKFLDLGMLVPATETRLDDEVRPRLAKRWSARAAALAIMVVGLAGPQVTMAQDQGATQAQSTEIVVTGSRIARSTFNSPTPLTVINADQIQKAGQINIAETIKVIPQNVASISDNNSGINTPTSALNVGAQIANLRGLNPTNAVRTLTLVDTKRFVPTTTGGAVDLNMIPSLLVQRVEVVTGGASAAYGTDALAGVVNVLLDKRFTGIKGQVDFGQTTYGDGSTYHGSLAAGTDFAGDRGHIIAGAEYSYADKVGDCTDVRTWCALSPDAYLNQNWNKPGQPNYGLPQYIRGNNGAYTNYNTSLVVRGTTAGPRFNPPADRNLTFSADGSQLLPFNPGNFTQTSGFFSRQGGDCVPGCSLWSEDQLRPSINRLATFAHADYDLMGTMKLGLEASYGHRGSHELGLDLGPSSATPIRTDYAYLTPAEAAQLSAAFPFAGNAGGASTAVGVGDPIFVGKLMKYVPGARNDGHTNLDTFHINASLDGDLTWLNDWKWNAYYQYGRTTSFQAVAGVRVNSFFSYALDAVRDPATGNIVCRATLPGPANTFTLASNFDANGHPIQLWNDPNAAGCVPLNILGTNTEDPKAVAYAYRTATENNVYEQHVISGNLNGNLFEGWAGPFGAALGGEYRHEAGTTTHNKLPLNGQFSQSPFGIDYAGQLDIIEGYVEVNAPLVKDLPLAKSIEVDSAFRQTQQTNTDGTTGQSKDLSFNTWKFSGTWDVTDWLRLRGTYSQDVRAAGYVDLYFAQQIIPAGPPAGNAFFPASNVTGASNIVMNIANPPNFKLDPEEGKTTTYGVVLKPHGFLEGLQISADYYRIHIAKAIATLTAQQVVDGCTNNGFFCNQIILANGTTYNPALGLAQPIAGGTINIGTQNIGAFVQQGYDFELDYKLDLERLFSGVPGTLTWRTIATYVPTFDVQLGPKAPFLHYAGQSGGAGFGGFTPMPPYLINNWLTYDNGPFSGSISTKWIPQGIYDIRRVGPDSPLYNPTTNPNSINDNTVGSRLYVGLAASYKFLRDGDHSMEAFATIDNLFDRDPPPSPGELGGTNAAVSGVGSPTNPVYYDQIGRTFRVGLRFAY